MQKVYYYVGSNNTTKKLEIEKIEKIVAAHFEGFTASEVIGYWRGNKERSLKVEIITDINPAEIARIARELKAKLDQESIMVEIIDSNCMFI